MSRDDPTSFDIDVDLSPLLGAIEGSAFVDIKWYELAADRPERCRSLHDKVQQAFRNKLLYAQWCATSRRRLDRRRAVRAPIVSRVHVEGGPHMVACDISMSGLRASGTPLAPVMNIELKLPGIPFPVDAKVEVVEFKDSNVIPLVGMRFVWIDRAYLDLIAQYVARRRQRSLRRAA